MSFKQRLERIRIWSEQPSGKQWLKWLDRFITVFLIALLVWQLYGQPIESILKSLPTHPLFYLLWIIIFFIVPVSEYLIYKLKWDYSSVLFFKGFMLKKIYNNELYNYTGEVFFAGWVSKRLKISTKEALLFVKDNNVVSSLASTLFAFLTLFILSYFGYFDLLTLLSGTDTTVIVAGGIFLLLAIVIGWRFRRKILHLNRAVFFKMFTAYTLRFIIRHFILLWMWILAAPEVSIGVWLNFMTVKILLDRLPVGNRSLILLSMAPWLSTTFDLSKEIFTGIQLSITLFDKAMSMIALVWAKRQPEIIETERNAAL